jgi:hypothetical protein
MARLIDAGDESGQQGAMVIGHTHNQRTWSPSHGQPLSREGYEELFETIEPRLFSEAGLFADVVGGGPLNLARRDSAVALDTDPALTIIASRNPDVFRPHPPETRGPLVGEYRLNPLYAADPVGDRVIFRLRFPSDDYADEYGACRQYLPQEVVVEKTALAALAHGTVPQPLEELIRRRVILDLPTRYY